jgi:type II secretory pathway pseudopilin PulG
MKNKGFTLVELIAIIIVIGLIIGILVPGVTEITEKTKMKSFQVGVQGYIKALSTDNFDRGQTYGAYILDKGVLTNINVYENVDIKTSVTDDKGYVFVDDRGKKFGNFYNDKYCAVIENDVINYSDNCNYRKYDNGQAIYYNPVTNNGCSSSNLNTATDAKSGCLKWHVFNDDEKNPYVTMILDHDTTIHVAFNSDGQPQIREAKAQLEEDTKQWLKYTGPRLITAKEITEITGYDYSILNGYYYLGNNSQEEPTFQEGTNPYKWLFNYTSGCKQYGCDVERTGEWGYWTSTIIDDNSQYIWHIRPNGTLNVNSFASTEKGIRPVITIPKKLLES